VAYAELLARTCFSLLDGASQPDELARAGASRGVAHLGIADRDGIYGVVQAEKSATELGVHLISGASLTVGERASIVVLARDLRGWGHLCDLLTLGRGRRPKGRCTVTVAEVAERAEGLVGVLRPGWTADEAGPLRDAFGSHLRVALSRDLSAADGPRVAGAVALSRALSSPLLATNDVRFHDPERRIVADVLTCIRRKTTLARAGRALLPNGERHLLDEAAFRWRYADFPAAIDEGCRAAESCTFTLDELRYGYPREVVPDGDTRDDLAAGAHRARPRLRYPGGVPPVGPRAGRARAHRHRASSTSRATSSPSRRRPLRAQPGHPVPGPGLRREQRGLLRARGHLGRPARTAPAVRAVHQQGARGAARHRRRLRARAARGGHPVRLRALRARPGGDGQRVHLLPPRSAVRDVGKVFGLSLDQVDRLAKALEPLVPGIDDRRRRARARCAADQPHEGGLDPDDVAPLVARPDSTRTVAVATLRSRRLTSGFPRHVSIHVGGFVIAARRADRPRPRSSPRRWPTARSSSGTSTTSTPCAS
jgi:error-prone DNA polymerase